MYELKTKLNSKSVDKFIDSITNEKRKVDSIFLINLIKEITNKLPKMWGNSIVGYGNIKYTDSTKKEHDWFEFGFSPRKNALTLYVTAYSDYIYKLSDEMGLKHGKGCVYIKDINNVNLDFLKKMIEYTLETE